MEENNNINLDTSVKNIVDKLSIVREDYVNSKKELAQSIRKDVIKTTLKDIINNTDNYIALKVELQKLIDTL